MVVERGGLPDLQFSTRNAAGIRAEQERAEKKNMRKKSFILFKQTYSQIYTNTHTHTRISGRVFVLGCIQAKRGD